MLPNILPYTGGPQQGSQDSPRTRASWDSPHNRGSQDRARNRGLSCLKRQQGSSWEALLWSAMEIFSSWQHIKMCFKIFEEVYKCLPHSQNHRKSGLKGTLEICKPKLLTLQVISASPERDMNAQSHTVGKWLNQDKKPDSWCPNHSQGLSYTLFSVSAAESVFNFHMQVQPQPR